MEIKPATETPSATYQDARDYIKFLREKVGTAPIILTGTTVFLFRNDGMFLMMKRRDNGKWSCPGGMLEPGESLEETAVREVLEETGINIETITLISMASGKSLFYRYPNGDEVYNVTAIYSARINNDVILVPKDNEAIEFDWFNYKTLPDELSPPTRTMLQDFVKLESTGLVAR